MNELKCATQLVSALNPGCSIDIDDGIIREIPPMHHKGFIWSPADRILEDIVGSSYEFRAVENPITRTVTFHRLETPLEDGRQTYVSPDRRDHYEFDGMFYRHRKR